MTTPPPDALEQVKRLEALVDKVAAPGSPDKDVTALLYALTWHASWLLPLARAQLEATTPRPEAEWHEDMGPVIWWTFPIEEPPYVGRFGDDDVPDYVTHFTSIPLPTPPQKDAAND